MQSDMPSADMSVQEVMDRWPHLVPLFRHYAEACVGCSLAPFCTVKEAAAEYGLPLDAFIGELRQSISEAGDGGKRSKG